MSFIIGCRVVEFEPIEASAAFRFVGFDGIEEGESADGSKVRHGDRAAGFEFFEVEFSPE